MDGLGDWERWAEVEHTAVVLAVVADHEHNFPLEDVVVDEATGDSWKVSGALHLLELTLEEACCA